MKYQINKILKHKIHVDQFNYCITTEEMRLNSKQGTISEVQRK